MNKSIGYALVFLALWITCVSVWAAENSPDLDDPVKIEWLSENAVPIRSIDPDDDDFADLMPLKSLLGGARVVMLGEATHGDGATFYAKQRLVRFLHEVMGFDVLAWEAHFFGMEELNRELESGQTIWIDSAWDEGGVMKPIYQYSRATLKTDRPLRHTGVDIVLGYPRARGIDRYRERLFEFLDEEGPDLASPQDLRMISEFFLTVQRGPYSPSEKESVKLRAAIGRVRDNLCEKAATVQDHREIEYFTKTLEELAAYEQHLILSTVSICPPRIYCSGTARWARTWFGWPKSGIQNKKSSCGQRTGMLREMYRASRYCDPIIMLLPCSSHQTSGRWVTSYTGNLVSPRTASRS